MLAPICKFDGNIDVIANTGIQFVDFEIEINFSDEKDDVAKKFARGYFFKTGVTINDPLMRLVPLEGEELVFIDSFSQRAVDHSSSDLVFDTEQSLALFNQVWFPIPYIALGSSKKNGPTNWARCRIVELENTQEENKEQEQNNDDYLSSLLKKGSKKNKLKKYHITLAFDTAIDMQGLEGSDYFAPMLKDIEAGLAFKFLWKSVDCSWFLQSQGSGKAWVNEWCSSIFTKLVKERLSSYKKASASEIETAIVQNHEHEAHYLNILAFLGGVVKLPDVNILPNPPAMGANPVDVSLILDIGNSRSCGIMVESHPDVTRSEDFSNVYTLMLRDLNASEIVYTDPFDSKVEFSNVSFDFDNKSSRSGRADAFTWHSFVRIGNEANKLASRLMGNEGRTGITSPKRYLWDKNGNNTDIWHFNTNYYQIDSKTIDKENKEAAKSETARQGSVCDFINSNGDALFAVTDDNYLATRAKYSSRSTMTFLLIEVFLQAIGQMNSLAQRLKCRSKNSPRNLQSVIMTVPPSMPTQEREILRSCIYEAIGILWKCLGYDKDKNSRFDFNFVTKKENMYPPVPQIFINWDEAQSGQVVYLYNEIQKVFNGRPRDFVKSLRRKDIDTRLCEKLSDEDGNTFLSTRIASLDIGGGTSDLVVIDYRLQDDLRDNTYNIIPNEVLREGFRVAGDDILYQIIKNVVIKAIIDDLNARNLSDSVSFLTMVFNTQNSDVSIEVLKQQLTQQLFVKVGLCILEHLEVLDTSKDHVYLTGSVHDFIVGDVVNSSLKEPLENRHSYALPMQAVVDFFNDKIKAKISDYNILDVKLNIDLTQIYLDILEGRNYSYTNVLKKLCEVVNIYDVDLLILTGRPSKLPFVRDFIIGSLPIPAARVINMHSYRCASWYPFSKDGVSIGDPKTTAAVGALLNYLRLDYRNFENFRYYAKVKKEESTMRYIGVLDNSELISCENVLYKYIPNSTIETMTNSQNDDSDLLWFAVKYNKDKQPPFNYERIDDETKGFKTTISLHIGVRQLEDSSFTAVPMYFIDLVSGINEIERVKKACAVKVPTNEQEEADFIHSLDYVYQEKAQNVLDNLNAQIKNSGDYIENLKASLSNDLEVKAREYANSIVQKELDNLSFIDKLKGKQAKLEQQKQSLYQEYFDAHYQSDVINVVEQKQSSYTLDLILEKNAALQQICQDNMQYVKEEETRKYNEIVNIFRGERPTVEVVLELINTNKNNYPYSFISKELPNENYSMLQVELKEVNYANKNLKNYFKLRFKTVTGSNTRYWLDSGRIEI